MRVRLALGVTCTVLLRALLKTILQVSHATVFLPAPALAVLPPELLACAVACVCMPHQLTICSLTRLWQQEPQGRLAKSIFEYVVLAGSPLSGTKCSCSVLYLCVCEIDLASERVRKNAVKIIRIDLECAKFSRLRRAIRRTRQALRAARAQKPES